MLAMLTRAVPQLEVNRARAAAALAGDPLVTDEVLRRVEAGEPFRAAYRAVAAEHKEGVKFPTPSTASIVARRRSVGGIGALGLPAVRARLKARRSWSAGVRRRFEQALARLAGTRSGARGR